MDGYGCRVYARGVEAHTDGRHRWRDFAGVRHFESPFRTRGGPRDQIATFSPESRRRLDWLLANAPVDFAVHATLTYHARVDESDGDQVAERNGKLVARAKADLHRFLNCIRPEVGAYCWIQEFQKRGAIHFHALFESPITASRTALAWCRATGQARRPARDGACRSCACGR